MIESSELSYITSDWILPITAPPIRDGVIEINQQGEIKQIHERSKLSADIEIQYFPGAICPGFINSHCHLELSHMKGKIPPGDNLIAFIKQVVRHRNDDLSSIQPAIVEADQYMYDHGIAAVGDISNSTDSFNIKTKSHISYHTFIEYFDLLDRRITAHEISKYNQVRETAQEYLLQHSAVPHAPYSVTPALFKALAKLNPAGIPVSIHNQETLDELLLFKEQQGGFIPFYNAIGIDLEDFHPETDNALIYALSQMRRENPTLLVHNTFTTIIDIQVAKQYHSDLFWCTCPNANLYIENKLPDYKAFMSQNCRMTIGTDSLASNYQLDIIEEIKTINKYYPEIPLMELLRWGTINGAQFLQKDRQLGSLEPGKKPGLVQILNFTSPEETDFSQYTVYRIK